MATFVHDAHRQIVYRMMHPKATPTFSGKSRVIKGWIVEAAVEETSAVRNGYLETSATTTGVIRSDEFANPPTSSAEIAINKFLVRGTPRGVRISEAEYLTLRARYEASFAEGDTSLDDH